MKTKEILEKKSIAYYSGFNGLEIKEIQYGIEDYIICITNAWIGENKIAHKLKIYHNQKESYFKLHGYKIPLNECILMNA